MPAARWMDLKYAGRCHVCGQALAQGARGFWDPDTRAVTCTSLECAETDGLTTRVWWGAPTSGSFVTRLNDHRVGPSTAPMAPTRPRPNRGRGRGRSSYRSSVFGHRCTHEDYPCCGCDPDTRSMYA